MSYSFGNTSLKRLATCDKRLQLLMSEVIKIVDITILEGHRDKIKQDNYYNAGKSQVMYPNSKHNKNPSMAVDIAVWHKKEPHIQWDNKNEWYYLAGIIKGISFKLGISIRWGGDWQSDNNFDNDIFFDAPHFELII